MKKQIAKFFGLTFSALLIVNTLSGCSSATVENGEHGEHSTQSAQTQNDNAKDDFSVKILNNKESLCLAPVHIAIINGYFDEEFKNIGQDYEVVTSNIDTVTEQITSRNINAGYGLTGTLMQPIANGLAISFVTGLHRGCTKFYSKNGTGINTLEDLKGKTIGVASLSDSAPIQLKRKLSSMGFNVNGKDADIHFATYGMTDLPIALDNGAVDAIGIHDPVAYNAEKNYDFIKLLDIGEDYEVVTSNIDTVTEQITSRNINAGYGLTGTLMQPIANGLAISFVTGLHRGCTKFYSKNGTGINTLEDLKGKTIGVASLSDSAPIQLKRKLSSMGFNVNGKDADIHFATYGMTDLPIALDNGAVDAIGIHDPVAYNAEKNYDFIKLLDIGEDENFSKEYCCQAYVSQELIENNPEGAAAYTRAIQKAAAFVEECPYEAAQLQVENGYMPIESDEDTKAYGEILERLEYEPSVSLGRETFVSSFYDLQKTGDLDENLNVDEFTSKVYPTIDGVPEGYTYDKATNTFTEIKK